MSGICVESEEKLPLTAAAPGLLQHDLLTISREEETVPKMGCKLWGVNELTDFHCSIQPTRDFFMVSSHRMSEYAL